MLISTFLEKEDPSEPVRQLTESLATLPQDKMLVLMREKTAERWNGLRVDLFHYVAVLNRIDGLLDDHVKKYGLKKDAVPLMYVTPEDEQLVTTLLGYSYSLLEYSNNKTIYNSAEHVFELINSTSLPIRVHALKLLCLLSERFSATENSKCAVPSNVRNQLLKLARQFPPQAMVDSGSNSKHTLKHISLLDCMTPENSSKIPPEWGELNFEYYSVGKTVPTPESDPLLLMSPIKAAAAVAASKKKDPSASPLLLSQPDSLQVQSHSQPADEGVRHFSISRKEVATTPYQEIYQRATKIIPSENWADFVIAVHVAKAYDDDKPENIAIRQQLVTMKCLSVAAASSCSYYSVLASTVFDEEPYLLSYMSDLINPENAAAVPYEASFAALRAFVNIACKKAGASDLMRAWGGNVSHGLLFHILRSILKDARADNLKIDTVYMNYIFNLLGNLLDKKSLVNHLRSAGLLNILLEFLQLRINYRMTRSGSLHLINIFVRSCPEVLDDLIASNGFDILIDLLKYEVDFAIENPHFEGGAPQGRNLSFQITLRQIRTINFVFKVAHDLITNHPGDRMRNLYDSPILQSFIKVLHHPTVFGHDILASVLHIIVGILNSEPTAYSILDEGGVIDAFFEQFDTFLDRSGDLILEVPDAINAIALNHAGHTRVLNEHLIPRFFTIFQNREICATLLKDDNCVCLGQDIDELGRHHPGLKSEIDTEIIKLIDETPSRVKFPEIAFYQSPKGSLYYSRDEEVVEKEEGSSKLTTWETCKEGDILECSAVFVSVLFDNARIWKNLFDQVKPEHLIRFCTVPNAPFDHVLSNSLYSVSSMIKAIDETNHCFALEALLNAVGDALGEIKDFIDFKDDSNSFFDQFDKNDPTAAQKGGDYISKIGIIDSLLYVLSDVYGSPNKLSANRIFTVSRLFSTNLDLIEELLMFYRRIALEEVILHSRTPQDAAKNVVPVNQGITRYHIEIGHPDQKSTGWWGTSAKFKNLSMLFFHFSRCQSWLRYIFASLNRLSCDRRQEAKFGLAPVYSLSVLLQYVNTTMNTLTQIDTSNEEIYSGYTLLILNQLYSTMFMRPRTTDPINAAMVVALLQNNGITTLRTLALKFFAQLSKYTKEDIEKYSNSKYVEIAAPSTCILVLNQILSIFAGISTKSMITYIPCQEQYYPDIVKNDTPFHRELGYSILVQTSLACYALLHDVFNLSPGNALISTPENIPISLVEKLLVISKNYSTAVTSNQTHVFEGRLYPLSVETARPSLDKVNYLCSLGLDDTSAMGVLILFRNSLDELYRGDPEESYQALQESVGDFGEEDWKLVCQKAKETPFVPSDPVPIPPQYAQACTLDDLNFARAASHHLFMERWIKFAELYPKSVFRVADLLLSICAKSSYLYFAEVIETVYSKCKTLLTSPRLDTDEQTANSLSSMLELLSSIIDDKAINRHTDIDESITSLIVETIQPYHAESVWFPSALMVLENFVAHSKLPKSPTAEKVTAENKLLATAVTFADNWCMRKDLEDELFEKLISLEHIQSDKTAVYVCLMLLLLCDGYERCARVYGSPVLKAILGCVKESTDTTTNLQSLAINLLRRCMENPRTIDAYMERELDKVLQPKRASIQKPRVRDLSSVVKENPALVLRSDDAFIETLSQKSYLCQCAQPLKSLNIAALKPEQKKFLEEQGFDLLSGQKDVKEVPYTTGIMHLLLSELMTVSRKDLIKTPPSAPDNESKEDTDENIKSSKSLVRESDKGWYPKDEMFKNTDLAYSLFLLQTIAELLFSYKQAKTEFLTFSKKAVDDAELMKPRTTALTLLVNRLLFSDPFKTSSAVELKRRRLLSQFASVCIFALVSTIPLKDLSYNDPKIVDPDMVFVRKFTVDILIKALQTENRGEGSAYVRYGKIVDILDVICKLLGDSFELSITSAIDGTVTRYDDYYIAKELLERRFSFLLTNILADLDVNIPYTKQISGSVMRCISSLGAIKVSDQELFKGDLQAGEGDEDEIDNDDDDDEIGQELPNLFQNSTLGMYDVDDVEDEWDDADEEILNDDDIEIIYSEEEEIVDSDEEMDSLAESDEGDFHEVGDDPFSGSDSDDARYLNDEEGYMIDVISDSSETESEAEDDTVEGETAAEGDDESDIIVSDADFDMFYDLGLEDPDDEGSDGLSDNSDDDSAILDDWINEHEGEEEARSRRASRAANSGFDDIEDDSVFDFNRIFASRPPRASINGGNGSDVGIGGIISMPPTESFARDNHDGSFSLLDVSGDTFSRTYSDSGSGPFMAFNMGGGALNMGNATLGDILRALQPHGGSSSRRNQHVPNIYLKSTVQRWLEVAHLYYGKTMVKESCRVVPSIVNNLYEKSMKISEEEDRKRQEALEKQRKAREELEKKWKEAEEKAAAERAKMIAEHPHEPVYVTIGGEAVDISGTDIDPEFLQALPDDMREEVFTQHIRQRRAESTSSGDHVREVDPDFLAALPEEIRSDIVRTERHYSMDDRFMETLGVSRDEEVLEDDDDDNDEEVGGPLDGDLAEPVPGLTDQKNGKKTSKVYFPAMVDRYGVAALLKMVFVPELYYRREVFFKTISYICYNKHTRSEVITILLFILQEGLSNQTSLESLYMHLCQRAKMAPVPAGPVTGESQKSPRKKGSTIPDVPTKLPSGCSTLTVATQAVDVINYLLENEKHLRFHFLMDQESGGFMKKIARKHKIKDNISYRYPINALLGLLDKDLMKEDANLMDVLSRSIQAATTPLRAMKAKLTQIEDEGDTVSKKPELPSIPSKNLKLVVNILMADECASKVFQQTISAIQNLSVLDNARVVFPHELSKRATALSAKIAKNLRALVGDLETHNGDLDKIKSLEEFSSASSDQAKLLRVLTALDYLFQTKDKSSASSAETAELKELYRSSALGPLWGALSDCLKLLEQRDDLSHVTTILSPLIEALMVVCKHSKVERIPIKDWMRYAEEKKNYDYASEPIEDLFFTFTEQHKKILNQMIRNNPKLMSGPFSVLIRNPKVLEFDNKRVYFQQKLHKENEERPELSVTVRRDQVFLDSYRSIFFKPPETIKKSNLELHFKGEEGVDAGGLTREWYQVLSRQIFNPGYALFTPVTSDKTTFHPNRTSWVNPEHLSFFKFVGMIIGKAVFDGFMLDCHFTRAVFKRILGKAVSLKDMESLDPDYYKSLVWMLENDITDIIVETFSVEADDYGEHKVSDLIPNGRSIAVTEKNKQEYVQRIVEYRLIESVKDQLENFLEGFYQIIPHDLVSIFDEQELELLISGLPDIDVDDWKSNTSYVNYTATSAQIQWFWRAVKSFDTEERAKLLQFATGTSKVPLNGFKELSGVNGVSKFSIHRVYSATDRLPSAHTCFNQIDLPEYESYEKLRGALLLAVREGHEGFGFV